MIELCSLASILSRAKLVELPAFHSLSGAVMTGHFFSCKGKLACSKEKRLADEDVINALGSFERRVSKREDSGSGREVCLPALSARNKHLQSQGIRW